MRLELDTDVLVVGGGMAAAWAAISAAQRGAKVVLADKGFVGASGVTATGGPNHWWVRPDPAEREAAIEARWRASFELAERAWMARVIETTWLLLPRLAGYYPFDTDGSGQTYYSGVRGPEYLRALRRLAVDSGVRILDHHPALELLQHSDGTIAGAAGYARLARRAWVVRAGAVILATGGCAFRSGLLGSQTNTGDGHLMAAETGAELSGMEFSVSYSLSPAWNSTRTMPYMAARFFDRGGTELDIPPPMSGPQHLRALALALAEGPVLADLADAPPLLKSLTRRIQPASPTPFDRKGLDMFKDRFEVALYGEGTIRGTGGLRIADAKCQTTTPGLFAAGDVATRELVAGATSGGGAQNSAWALTSGWIAGEGAAEVAWRRTARTRTSAEPKGRVALRPAGAPREVDLREVIRLSREQILDPMKALWRSRDALEASQSVLDALWIELATHLHATGLDQVAARETAALVMTARWCNSAALAREESRGMHMRADAPSVDPALARRLRIGGFDRIWTHFEPERVAV